MENGNTFGMQDIVDYRGLGLGYNGQGINANSVRLDRNSQKIEDQGDCTRTVLGENMRFIQNSSCEAAACNRHSQLLNLIWQNQLSTQNQMANNAAKAAECCCENKQLILETKADLTALIKDTTIADLQAQLNKANIEAACNNHNH